MARPYRDPGGDAIGAPARLTKVQLGCRRVTGLALASKVGREVVMGGVKVYQTALRCVQNEDLKDSPVSALVSASVAT